MCRSPAAEKLLAHYGGTAAQPYCKMPRQITDFLTRQGVANLGHKPALAAEADIDWADLVLVMEGVHRDILADKFPQSMRKTHLLLDYCGGSGDLRDPMGKSEKVFEEVLEQILEAIKRLTGK